MIDDWLRFINIDIDVILRFNVKFIVCVVSYNPVLTDVRGRKRRGCCHKKTIINMAHDRHVDQNVCIDEMKYGIFGSRKIGKKIESLVNINFDYLHTGGRSSTVWVQLCA